MFNAIADAINKKAEAYAKAYARKIDAEAEAYVRKIDAEAEAYVRKVDAETNAIKRKIDAETNAIKRKIETEKVASDLAKKRFRYMHYVGISLFAFLWADFIYHDYEPFIKWKMKYHIRRGDTVPAAVPNTSSAPDFYFSRSGANSFPSLSQLPTLFIGPSGCGKTTALHEYAASLKKRKSPVVFINLRAEQDRGDENKSGDVQLEALTKLICTRIYYPFNRSYVQKILSKTKFEKGGASVDGKDIFPSNFYLVRNAVETLFQCLDEISEEMDEDNRALSALGKPKRTAPVFIIDEVLDLIRDERLASVGGNQLFRRIGTLLTRECVDNKRIHAFLASSSNQMVSQFAKRKLLLYPKSKVFELNDFDSSVIVARLKQKGYSESDANEILNVAGTRLRSLKEPLSGNTLVNVQAWKIEQLEAVHECFKQAFASICQSNWPILISMLENIRLHGSFKVEGKAVEIIDKFDLSFIFYISKDKVKFQSRTHELYWSQNRERLKKEYSA